MSDSFPDDRRANVPSVVSIPSHDVAFRTHVEVAVDALMSRSRLTADALRAAISTAYPDATVHVKQELTSFTPEVVLYAYRDRQTARAPESESWWEEDGLPATVVSDDGVYLDGNDAALELFGIDLAQLIGSGVGSFTRHEGAHLAVSLFETLAATGHLDSTAVVVRPDGREIRIAYHMIRDAAGAHRHRTVMRPLPG
jgi:PAS domain-containing protein